MSFSASDVIAIIAVLIAGLSTLYARWAWKEANRANELSLLAHRKEIFDALCELNMHITQKGQFCSVDEVSKFQQHSRNASCYFSETISSKISNYYDNCFKAADLARLHNEMYPSENRERYEALQVCRAIYPEIESAVRDLISKAARNV